MDFPNLGRGREWRTSAVLGFCVHLVCQSVLSAPASFSVPQPVSDECDWFGSGVDTSQNVGVQPVYLRCHSGVIEWQYPKNAARIILRLGQSDKKFKGCLKVAPSSSGVTLYLEQPKRLKYLYGLAEETEDKAEQMCFKSVGGQVALFLEAHTTESSLEKSSFNFVYDLQPIQKKRSSECQPCTGQELLYSYCTSDFAARGSVSSLYQNEYAQKTELTVHSHYILRDSETKVFHQVAYEHKNGTYFSGLVHRPLHCGTKVGRGDFLFMGQWRLGLPMLTCVPRWTEWKKIRQKALESNDLDCDLE